MTDSLRDFSPWRFAGALLVFFGYVIAEIALRGNNRKKLI